MVPGELETTGFMNADFLHAKSALNDGTPRDDVERKVVEAQQRLVELKRAQEELERERSSLEELRRRQNEFVTGRQEMLQNLTRGVGLLEEAEFSARRDLEQMSKTLADFRLALEKIQAIRDEHWTKENFQVELTRALTTVENGRMEWNSARLKLPLLGGEKPAAAVAAPENVSGAGWPLGAMGFGQLCRLGLALTWPLVVVALVALGLFLALLIRK